MAELRVAFRVDSSAEVGTGHVMRCLTLADALADRGAECLFLCRRLADGVGPLIAEPRHRLVLLPDRDGPAPEGPPGHAAWLGAPWERDSEDTEVAIGDAFGAGGVDWLVVDHYGIDARWERALRGKARFVLVIDDLADRHHDCDVLLDQNLRVDGGEAYRLLLPARCRTLLGPSYALLRPEFALERAAGRERDGTVRRILVFMGGADPDGITEIALDALSGSVRKGVEIEVVVGEANSRASAIRRQFSSERVRVHVGTNTMAVLMRSADLAIGGAGTATWERMALGLPSAMVVLAENQESICQAVDSMGLGWCLGRADKTLGERLAGLMDRLLVEPETVRRCAVRAAAALDAAGTSRVAGIMEELAV